MKRLLLTATALLAVLPASPAQAGSPSAPEGAVRCPDVLDGLVSVRRIYVLGTDCRTATGLGVDSAYDGDPPEGWTCEGHSGVSIRWRYHVNVQCSNGAQYAQWVVFAYPDALVPFSRPLYVTANSRGPRLIGPLTRGNLSVDRVYTVFGDPYRTVRIGRGDNACRATWPDLGLTIVLANFGTGGCEEGFAQSADIGGARSKRWRTNRGLRVGESLRLLRHLYPKASRHGRRWWLVRGISPFTGDPYGVVDATVRGGHVRSLHIEIGGAGD